MVATTFPPLKSFNRRFQKVWIQRVMIAAGICFFLILAWQLKKSIFEQKTPSSVSSKHSNEEHEHTTEKHVLKPMLNSHQIPTVLTSAFRDPRSSDVIVMHLITSNAIELLTLFCHYRRGNQRLYTANAQPPMPSQQYKPRFFTFVFHCPLWNPVVDPTITHVAMSEYHEDPGARGVPLIDLNKPATTRQDICVCVSPTAAWRFSHEDIVAWIEMNRLLGVSFFIFYNHSIPATFKKILTHYASLGVVSILHWHLHLEEHHEAKHIRRMLKKLPLHYSVTAYNDCVYRATNSFRYAVLLEPDELLIPNLHSNISDLLDELETKGGDRHAFKFDVVYLPHEKYQQPLVENSEIHFLKTSTIMTFPDPNDQLSAFVVKPDDSGEIKDLTVHPHASSKSEMVAFHVSPKLATLRRYRQFVEDLNHPECHASTDNRLSYFIPKLMNAVANAFQDIRM